VSFCFAFEGEVCLVRRSVAARVTMTTATRRDPPMNTSRYKHQPLLLLFVKGSGHETRAVTRAVGQTCCPARRPRGASFRNALCPRESLRWVSVQTL